jgi:hypothetical protein
LSKLINCGKGISHKAIKYSISTLTLLLRLIKYIAFQLGVYLDNYFTKDEKFNLYAINMFFVEVCYNSLENKISGIKSFKSGHLLDRYSNIDNYKF